MDESDVEIIDHANLYQGYFKIDHYRLRHRIFDRGWSGEISRDLFERGHAVGVLPYDPDLDQVVLIEQFRIGGHAAPGFSPWQIEAVAGMIEPGQTPEQAAERETLEETGLEVMELHFVNRYLTSPGCTSESLHGFCARVDSSQAGGIFGETDEHEFVRAFALPAQDAFAMTEDGRVANAVTMIALQWLELNRDEMLRRWS
jgi:ADP-ribose pyrophosphatase